MPSGMELMMKSFGIDPEKIKADFRKLFEDTTAEVKAKFEELQKAQLETNEKLDRLLTKEQVPIPATEVEPDWSKDHGNFDGPN
jgi:DNA polymerase/3'-5' exonuclease PolX